MLNMLDGFRHHPESQICWKLIGILKIATLEKVCHINIACHLEAYPLRREKILIKYFGVRNISAQLLLILENIFLPTLFYLELHCYQILGNFPSYTIILDYTFISLLVNVYKTLDYKSKKSILLLTPFWNLLYLPPIKVFSQNKKVQFGEFVWFVS